MGNNYARKGSKTGKKVVRKNGYNRRKPKETEVNIDDNRINVGDLPHVVTEAKKNNDAAWYTHIYPAVNDYASIPFPIPAGNDINMGKNGAILPSNQTSVPGIMTIKLAPTIGKCEGNTDAANLAAQQIYTLDRKANSGAKNYDKTDVMMLIIALDSAYMLYEEAVRAYKLLGSYNYMNRYLPDVLLQALGWNPSVFKSNMADFRGAINLFAYELASINVPDQFDFIHRHSWLFTNVYKDSASAKAQMYAYIPDGYYVWTEGTEDGNPTKLTYTRRATSFDSLAAFVNTKNSIMQPLLGSQDVGTISGDLAKAFGDNGMISFKPVADQEFLDPVFSEEVLTQISNLMFVPGLETSSMNITQVLSDTTAGPYLRQRPQMPTTFPHEVKYVKPMLNLPGGYPITAENTLVATRLMGTWDDNGYVTSAGTELVTGINIYYKTPTGYTNSAWTASNFYGYTDDSVSPANIINIVSEFSKFDWCPSIYFINMSSADQPIIQGYMMDTDTFAIMEDSTIQNLNEVANMSLFAVKDFRNGLTK